MSIVKELERLILLFGPYIKNIMVEILLRKMSKEEQIALAKKLLQYEEDTTYQEVFFADFSAFIETIRQGQLWVKKQ